MSTGGKVAAAYLILETGFAKAEGDFDFI